MIAKTDETLLAGRRAAEPAGDATLFALIDELRAREKCRDALLDRLARMKSDPIEAAAKEACDAARQIYQQIAAIKPTTVAGLIEQLELAAEGWVAPSTLPVVLASLREIAQRPAPFKMGKLPSVPVHPCELRHPH